MLLAQVAIDYTDCYKGMHWSVSSDQGGMKEKVFYSIVDL